LENMETASIVGLAVEDEKCRFRTDSVHEPSFTE